MKSNSGTNRLANLEPQKICGSPKDREARAQRLASLFIGEMIPLLVQVRQDITHTSVFVHISQVADRRVLHLGDRIRFEIADNPERPGKTMAVGVSYLGHAVARQISDRTAVRP